MYFVVFRNPSLSFPPIGWIAVLLWIYYMFIRWKILSVLFPFYCWFVACFTKQKSRFTSSCVSRMCMKSVCPKVFSYKHELWLVACRIKNVPWHILAPAAVACDIYLIRRSAHPRGAFLFYRKAISCKVKKSRELRWPQKVRLLLRNRFCLLRIFYAAKRLSLYWTGLIHPSFSLILCSL